MSYSACISNMGVVHTECKIVQILATLHPTQKNKQYQIQESKCRFIILYKKNQFYEVHAGTAQFY